RRAAGRSGGPGPRQQLRTGGPIVTSVVAVEHPANGADPLPQPGRMLLANDAALLPRGMHDLAALECDRDVVAVAEQVAGPDGAQRDLAARLLLLVGISRQQHAEASMHGLHQAG